MAAPDVEKEARKRGRLRSRHVCTPTQCERQEGDGGGTARTRCFLGDQEGCQLPSAQLFRLLSACGGRLRSTGDLN